MELVYLLHDIYDHFFSAIVILSTVVMEWQCFLILDIQLNARPNLLACPCRGTCLRERRCVKTRGHDTNRRHSVSEMKIPTFLGEMRITHVAIARANSIDNNIQQFVCCKPLLLPLQAVQILMIQPYRQRRMKQRCHTVKGWTAVRTGGTEVHILISTAPLCSSHCPASGTAWAEQTEI